MRNVLEHLLGRRRTNARRRGQPLEGLAQFAVLDHGGMTRAAEHLDMSQSAVSCKIKRLEERVGRPLLMRDDHTIRPSRDGRALIDDARLLVATHDQAVERLRSSDLTGHVKVGSNEEVDATRMAAVLGRFKRAHPGATIEFVIDHTEHLLHKIGANEIDVAIVQVDDDHLEPGDEKLWSDRLCWASSCECTFPEGPVPLITFGVHCFYRAISEPLLTAAGIEYTAAFSVSTTAGVRAAIGAGLGVGVISSRYLDTDVIEWPRGAATDRLPAVHQIARTAPSERSPIVDALMTSIVDELRGIAPLVTKVA